MGNLNYENSAQTLGRWFITGCGAVFVLFGLTCLSCNSCLTSGSSKNDDIAVKSEEESKEDEVPIHGMSLRPIVEFSYPSTKIKTDKVFGKSKAQVRAVSGKPEESEKGDDGKYYDAYTFGYGTTLFIKYNKKGAADEIEIWTAAENYITERGLSSWLGVNESKVNIQKSKCIYCSKIDKYNGGECVWKSFPSNGCTEFVLTRRN